ncbi:Syd protein [Streptomyces sp. NBRC 110611]|uniref:hypothetical protein n=1 Tax=Streptomyces sp. NBRC 110611 TaxID=1621259 RepID=UPI0008308488|nr:hypothetical protein [Streptomyces sp. NBRC 110611]GAU68740.1 Syd protein [Streptomyces sp. NBRC 110611]
MPAILISVSVLMQAGCFGYLSGRLTPSGSLLLSCTGFFLSALLFTAVHLLRRARRRGPAPAPARALTEVPPAAPADRQRMIRLMLLMNLVTATTFVSFYVSLAWIPATLASGLETAVGPLALALLTLTLRLGERPRPRVWGTAAALAAAGGALAWSLTDGADLDWSALAGLGLVIVAGVGASGLALVSKALGGLGADPVTVTAHRFHLTYLGAGALFLLQGHSPHDSGIPPALIPLLGVVAITIPLFVLQIGLQRAHPMAAMTILTTLPGLTYLSETLWGGSVNIASLALTGLLVVLAAVSATPRRSGEGDGGTSHAFQAMGEHRPPELSLASVENKDTS